jgi:diacylglycerol O-acyltransferase / wax synthase
MPALSPVDQAFFMLETPERPMNVGVLIVLPPDGGPPRSYADRLVAGMLKCPVGPPFNYRLKPGPVPPLLALEEDPQVDARRQVHRHALPRGSSLDALFSRVCAVHVELLPRDEPIWQMHVFTGLPDGRVALYFKTHHGLIDGMGFIRVVTSVVSTSKAHKRPRAIWEGMPPTQQAARAPSGDAISVGGLLAFANAATHNVGDLARLFLQQVKRGLGQGQGLALPFVTTPDVLRVAPSSKRVMAHCAVPLSRVRAIGRRGEAKVNDVMLAAIDAAMHRYLEERDSPPAAPLIADVPVALADDGGTGNAITILQVPMGKPGATPAERLQQIVGETKQMKHAVRTHSPGSITLYSVLGHSAASALEALRLPKAPLLANVVISNPAGLERRVYFNGVPVELALPVSVVAHQQVLNVTLTTYVDQLHVTFIALREAIPDVRKLAGYVTEALDRLDEAVVATPHEPAARKSSKPAGRRRKARD